MKHAQTDKMMSLRDCYTILSGALKDIYLGSETIAVENALNRFLAEDQYSQLDIPLFSRSSMDGYAILPDDKSEKFQIVETVAAGQTAQRELKSGTAIKIMTGAPIPRGAGKVIPIEQALAEGDAVKFSPPFTKTNIAWQGEDFKKGDLLLKAAVQLGAVEIANLINCGIKKINVHRRPKIAIITTGNEIVSDPELLCPGKIMNSNGPMLAALCEKNGFNVIANLAVADDTNLIKEILSELESTVDLLIITGGVSVGDFDFVAETIMAGGYRIHFDKVAIKPGKPMTFASKANIMLFGLPGNPVSVYLTFHLFVLKAIRYIFGCGIEERTLSLFSAGEFNRKSAEKTEYVPGKLLDDGTVLALKSHGSGHLGVLLDCDGFMIMDQGITKVSKDEKIRFLPINYK